MSVEMSSTNPEVSRRDFCARGALATLAPWSIGAAFAADPARRRAQRRRRMRSRLRDALKRLMDGNARYAANTPNERDFSSGRARARRAVSDRRDLELRRFARARRSSRSTRRRAISSSCASRATS